MADAWSLFIKPLSTQLWAALALHSLFLIIILRVMWLYYDRLLMVKIASIMEYGCEAVQYWIVLSASYLGIGFTKMPHNRQSAVKVILFSSSMVGVVIWMSYRASLASMLAITEYYLPFESISGLADNGDYRYVCIGYVYFCGNIDASTCRFMMAAGGSTSTIFYKMKNANDTSPEKRLFREHIQPDVNGSTFVSDT